MFADSLKHAVVHFRKTKTSNKQPQSDRAYICTPPTETASMSQPAVEEDDAIFTQLIAKVSHSTAAVEDDTNARHYSQESINFLNKKFGSLSSFYNAKTEAKKDTAAAVDGFSRIKKLRSALNALDKGAGSGHTTSAASTSSFCAQCAGCCSRPTLPGTLSAATRACSRPTTGRPFAKKSSFQHHGASAKPSACASLSVRWCMRVQI